MTVSPANVDWSRRHPSHPHKRRRRADPIVTPAPLSTTWSRLPLGILCIIALSLVSSAQAAVQCLRFADAVTINQLFTDGGPGTKVLLCPSKVYRISGTISFTAADQELATYGYPSGPERATLRVESGKLATAIQGDCRRCARIGVRSLIIDGNRQGLGRMVEYDPSGLVVIGGNEGQSIRECKISDPRGFTAVHVREGDKLSCSGAVIEKNEIGPVGEEYDPAVDGDDPEMSPLGRPLADGLSIACRDSFVRDNTFVDNTAAAIVVYCSPGTLVHANRISARARSMMGGILMVDETPFKGDYSKMVVKSNIIDAVSRTIRVGIGIGAAVWSDDIETILKGGTVLANSFKGQYMGYGIAAAGLNGWTIKDNWDEAVHQGKRSARCFEDQMNPEPMAFLYNSDTVKESDIQSGFTDGKFEYVVCIDGLEDSSNPPKAAITATTGGEEKQRDVEAADPIADTPLSTEPEMFSTGSEVMDDILEHSQQRMLEAFSHLSKRVDGLATRRSPIQATHDVDLGTMSDLGSVMMSLSQRVEAVEAKQKAFIELVTQLRRDIKSWDEELHPLNRWQSDAILSIQEKLYVFLGHSPADMVIDTSNTEGRDHWNAPEQIPAQAGGISSSQGVGSKAKRSWVSRVSGSFGSLSGILHILAVSVIIGGLCELGKRYWSTRRTHRKVM